MKKHKRQAERPLNWQIDPFPSPPAALREINCSAGGGFVGKCRKGRFHWILGEADTIKRRELFCWMFAGGRQVGAVAFTSTRSIRSLMTMNSGI